MRPALKELCGIDPKTLIGVPKEIADERIIDALHEAKDELGLELNMLNREPNSYQKMSLINARMNYISKAIVARVSDLEEMGIEYRRTK